MATVHLLTWNLNKKEAALEALVQHIASRVQRAEPFIAVVQECVLDCKQLSAKVKTLVGSEICAVGNGTMSVLSSESLEPFDVPTSTVHLRLVLTGVTIGNTRIAVVNYHGMAQGMSGSIDSTERGGVASEARWLIDHHAANAPAIVLGDFNAEITSSEIRSRFCFAFEASLKPISLESHNRKRRKLHVIPPTFPPGVTGTKRYDSNSLGEDWQTFDFIAADASLSIATEVLSSINGDSLWNGLKITSSDHLPVSGKLDLP